MLRKILSNDILPVGAIKPEQISACYQEQTQIFPLNLMGFTSKAFCSVFHFSYRKILQIQLHLERYGVPISSHQYT